jgi:predicted ATP-dependent endonuclease of OLD family
MQIKSLQIKQYKSLNNLMLNNLFDINIFIGPNNSGKSNVLDAIESVFLSMDNSNFFIDQGSNYVVEIELDIEAKKFWSTVERTLIAKREGNVKTYFLGKKKINSAKKVESFFSQRTVRFNNMLVNNAVKIREDYADLKLNYPTASKKLWQAFRQLFPDIDEIISSEISAKATSEIKTKLKQGGKIVDFNRLGTGVRRIFVIMLYIFHPRYSIVLMNEPEIHLHPGLIKKVANLLQANVVNQQVFLTTHSPIFITPNNLQQVFRVNKNKGQDTEVYYFTPQDNINSKRLVQEFNADNLEMFFADKVVIVEGVSDKILLRGLIDKFYKGTNEIKVISVAGKDNIGIYIKLMKIFKIPYLVLLDRDALYGTGATAIQQYLSSPIINHRIRHKRKKGKKYRRERRIQGIEKHVAELKKHHIYILPNGDIEKNYPRKYQRRDTKPLNALYAASQITEQDFYSPMMRYLREVIEAL